MQMTTNSQIRLGRVMSNIDERMSARVHGLGLGARVVVVVPAEWTAP